MQVLSWIQKRKRLLRHLAGLDSTVARRIPQVEAAWEEARQELPSQELPELNQEFQAVEDFLMQPKPPVEVEAGIGLQEVHDSEATPAQPPTEKSKSIASYLD